MREAGYLCGELQVVAAVHTIVARKVIRTNLKMEEVRGIPSTEREGERPRGGIPGLDDLEPAYGSDLARILLRLCAVELRLVG